MEIFGAGMRGADVKDTGVVAGVVVAITVVSAGVVAAAMVVGTGDEATVASAAVATAATVGLTVTSVGLDSILLVTWAAEFTAFAVPLTPPAPFTPEPAAAVPEFILILGAPRAFAAAFITEAKPLTTPLAVESARAVVAAARSVENAREAAALSSAAVVGLGLGFAALALVLALVLELVLALSLALAAAVELELALEVVPLASLAAVVASVAVWAASPATASAVGIATAAVL
jgi:hypothetical protein